MEESLPTILVDSRLPKQILEKLTVFGKLLLFNSDGITYNSISCHPDIFVFQSPSQILLAPNTPEKLISELVNAGIKFTIGNKAVGCSYPSTATYNAFANDSILVYSKKATDLSIIENSLSQIKIPVKQGYIRCNMLNITPDCYITSDMGICKALIKNGFECHYFSPEGIFLQGFRHGFLGGCMGYWERKLFISGSLKYYPQGRQLMKLLVNKDVEIHELHECNLIDGGGILFFK
jgi:hypothetical protein